MRAEPRPQHPLRNAPRNAPCMLQRTTPSNPTRFSPRPPCNDHPQDLLKVSTVDSLQTQVDAFKLKSGAGTEVEQLLHFAASTAEKHVAKADPTTAAKLTQNKKMRLAKVEESLKKGLEDLEQRAQSTSLMNVSWVEVGPALSCPGLRCPALPCAARPGPALPCETENALQGPLRRQPPPQDARCTPATLPPMRARPLRHTRRSLHLPPPPVLVGRAPQGDGPRGQNEAARRHQGARGGGEEDSEHAARRGWVSSV